MTERGKAPKGGKQNNGKRGENGGWNEKDNDPQAYTVNGQLKGTQPGRVGGGREKKERRLELGTTYEGHGISKTTRGINKVRILVAKTVKWNTNYSGEHTQRTQVRKTKRREDLTPKEDDGSSCDCAGSSGKKADHLSKRR